MRGRSPPGCGRAPTAGCSRRCTPPPGSRCAEQPPWSERTRAALGGRDPHRLWLHQSCERSGRPGARCPSRRAGGPHGHRSLPHRHRWRRSATSCPSGPCCRRCRGTWRTCSAATGSRSGWSWAPSRCRPPSSDPGPGGIGDRYGRRVLLSGGALLVGVTTLAYTLVDAVPGLVVLRLVTGLGEAAVFVGAATATQDLAPIPPAWRSGLLLQRRPLQRPGAGPRAG